LIDSFNFTIFTIKINNTMKHLIYISLLFLISCTKSTSPIIQSKTIFYKIQEVGNSGAITESEIKHINLETSLYSKNEDDDDDDHDGHDCGDTTVLSITVGTFNLTKITPNSVKIYWESENENNTKYYNVQKSYDSKSWEIIDFKPKKLGKYTVIDKIK